MKSKLKNITVLFNKPEKNGGEGWESDFDTFESADLVFAALQRIGYPTELKAITGSEISSVKKINADLVFNLAEWSGKDFPKAIEVIRIMEKSGIRFTGTGSRGMKISGDKLLMKQLFDKYGIPSPNWRVNRDTDEKIDLSDLKYPVISKPVWEHCGIGIDQTSITENEQGTQVKVREMLSRYKQPVLTEEYIPGREIQVTILEKNGSPWVLPPAEVLFKPSNKYRPILTYAAKWDMKTDEYKTSSMIAADLDKRVLAQIDKIAKICHRRLEAWGYARLDIRLDDRNRIWVLELNNNPGIDYEILSGIGVSARLVGMTFEDLVRHVAENAYLRFSHQEAYAAL